MTYPIDQLTALASANQKLAIRFANIAREAGQRQAQIAIHAVSAAMARDGDSSAQAPTLLHPAGFSRICEEAEQARQASVAETRAAVEEWWAGAGSLFSPEAAQRQVAGAYEAWGRLFASPTLGAAGTAPAGPPPARTKPRGEA